MDYENWSPPKIADLRTKLFEMYPFRCADCGIECNFRNPAFSYMIPGHTVVMLENYSDSCLCGHCLAKRIRLWFATPETDPWPDKERTISKCDACGETALLANWIDDRPNLECRFGTQWWNGFWICCNCLSMCAENGSAKSRISILANGKHYQINEAGAQVLI